MRLKILILFLIITGQLTAMAATNPKDSLLQLLPQTMQPQQRLRIYRNLADLTLETPAEKEYLKHAYEEVLQTGDNEESVEILGDLSFAYIKTNNLDSAHHYLDIIKSMKKSELTKGWITYLNMRIFDQRITREDNKKLFEEALKKKKDNNKTDTYSEIERAYIISRAIFENENYSEALPYIETANQLSQQLPFKEGFKFRYITQRGLSRNYTLVQNFAKSLTKTEELMNLHVKYYELYLKKKRPFYYIDSYYIAYYNTLLTNSINIAPEKVDFYAAKISDLFQKIQSPLDKYSCLLALYNYSVSKMNLNKAITLNDSLIKYAEIITPENLPNLYKLSSTLYEMTDQYKSSLQALKQSYALQDSFNTFKSQEQLHQLQVKYDVDKLTFEKSQLEIKNKRILVFTLAGILTVSILISLYLLRNLKKEQKMKAELRMLNNKAEESENMKTAFINSICHEIRTPLNSIVGFTDLIFDSSIDEDIRNSFPEEIQKNTNLLTSLINSMLEVSNLNVSDEKLPSEPIDLNNLCHREIDRLKEYGKPGIDFRLDIPSSTTIISSNERYLSLMLESLLNNANKFTEAGQITLHYHVNNNEVQIHITDTGCGIPVEKREEVFERFTKLDTYKPGNGLGLYLCRLIVQRLSGKIYIDPDYSGGTRFIILISVN